MISFLGAGGGGDGSCAVVVFSAGGAMLSFDACCGALSPLASTPFPPSPADFLLAPESCRALLDALPALLGRGGGALSAGALAAGAAAAGGVISATALGFPILLTSRLLITVLTPAMLAACFPAASRCASLSTVPDSVTTPLSAFTASCLLPRPESWLNLFWISLDIFVSSGFFAQPTPIPKIAANKKLTISGEFLFIRSTPAAGLSETACVPLSLDAPRLPCRCKRRNRRCDPRTT